MKRDAGYCIEQQCNDKIYKYDKICHVLNNNGDDKCHIP